jgi:hypothetical protein
VTGISKLYGGSEGVPMNLLGWVLLIYGFGAMLVLPRLPGIPAEMMHGFGYDIRTFAGLQAILAGTSLLKHPRPISTLAVIGVATIPIVLLLRADQLWWAAAIMGLQGIPLWFVHRKQQEPASTQEGPPLPRHQ